MILTMEIDACSFAETIEKVYERLSAYFDERLRYSATFKEIVQNGEWKENEIDHQNYVTLEIVFEAPKTKTETMNEKARISKDQVIIKSYIYRRKKKQ